MKIKKASPGLDPRNRLGGLLGEDFVVEDFDPARPLRDQVADAHVLVVRDVAITREVMDAAPQLRLIQRPGDHLPKIDLDYARGRDIVVSRFPSAIQGRPAGGSDFPASAGRIQVCVTCPMLPFAAYTPCQQ